MEMCPSGNKKLKDFKKLNGGGASQILISTKTWSLFKFSENIEKLTSHLSRAGSGSSNT